MKKLYACTKCDIVSYLELFKQDEENYFYSRIPCGNCGEGYAWEKVINEDNN